MTNDVGAGRYHTLGVKRLVSIGAYLEFGKEDLLLPNRYMPEGLKKEDEIEVFVYHDSEDRLIATTLRPLAVVGEFASLKVVGTNPQGAFLDWGLPKDLYVPKSQQRQPMQMGRSYLVYLYVDAKTGRVAATEWFAEHLQKDTTGLQPMQPVQLVVWRKSPLGYTVIIDHTFEGLIHSADAVVPLQPGQKLSGFIKQIRPDGKLDVVPGKAGYRKVSGEAERILELLAKHQGILPYSDSSDPADIYAFFGISKKAFKMAIGSLYKQRLIEILPGGIRSTDGGEGILKKE
jgi:hypothetical protein